MFLSPVTSQLEGNVCFVRGDHYYSVLKLTYRGSVKETVYNLFLYVEKSLIRELGIAIHELDGTEEEKSSTLQALVDQDYKIAKRYPVTEKFEWHKFESRMRLGRQLEVFEKLLLDCNAPINPLVVITPIVDERPKILAITSLGPLNLGDLQISARARKMFAKTPPHLWSRNWHALDCQFVVAVADLSRLRYCSRIFAMRSRLSSQILRRISRTERPVRLAHSSIASNSGGPTGSFSAYR